MSETKKESEVELLIKEFEDYQKDFGDAQRIWES